MIPAENAKTMEAFNRSINSFTDGFKAYAKSVDQAGGAAITRAHEALPGVAKKGIETAKLTGSDMNQAIFEGSPLGTAIGESTMSMGKAFLGMDEKKEDDSTVISSTEGAGESLSQLDSQSDALDDMKRLLSNIDVGIDSLVNISSEMLAVWVDASEMERIMHEELMSESAADRLRSIEQERERKASSGIVPVGEDGEAPTTDSGGPGILGALGNVFQSIPGFKIISRLFSGGLRGITKLFGKLFWPITMITGIISFVTGFMEGYEEGGLQEGITQGFEKLIENLIDVPLNFLKDTVAFIAGLLGFEEFEKQLNDMGEIDISSMVRPIVEWFASIPEKIKELMISVADSLPNIMGYDVGGKLLDLLGIEKEESTEAETPPPAKPTPASAPKKSSPSENIPLTEAFESLDPFKQEALLLGPKHIDPMQADDFKAGAMTLLTKTGYEYDTADKLARDMGYDFDAGQPSGTQAEALAQTAGGDRRAGAAAAIQDAGVSSGMAGGGASPTVIIDQKDQSVSQAASNLIPMPFTTQTDPAMSQSANVDL
tara:strand:+ start:2559 stop:4190 length:1632 start_codon:yes stop_codon:yes gene_type:complete